MAALGVVQAPPAGGPNQAIAAALRTCIEATSATGIDEARLRSAGWDAYDIDLSKDDDGSSGMRVYNRGRGPILLAGSGADSRETGCNVIAPLTTVSGFGAVVEAFSTELRAQPTGRKPTEVFWVIGDKGILLAATGGKTRPAVRATVVHTAEEK